MTVSITSRYRGLDVYPATDDAGVVHPTVAIRRTTAPGQSATPAYQHRVTGVESLEYLAWRFYGDSEQWWRIADANPTAFPLKLRPGDVVAIPTGDAPVTPDRTRVF